MAGLGDTVQSIAKEVKYDEAHHRLTLSPVAEIALLRPAAAHVLPPTRLHAVSTQAGCCCVRFGWLLKTFL